jgi:hypothetical protein
MIAANEWIGQKYNHYVIAFNCIKRFRRTCNLLEKQHLTRSKIWRMIIVVAHKGAKYGAGRVVPYGSWIGYIYSTVEFHLIQVLYKTSFSFIATLMNAT